MKKWFIKYWRFFVFLLVILLIAFGAFFLKDELFIISTRVTSPNRYGICEQNDLKSVARKYLEYVEENYFEDNQVVEDPVSVYGNSNINYENEELKYTYLPFSPSRFINMIYATILSEEYLGLDNTLSTPIMDRYFEITAPFSLMDNYEESESIVGDLKGKPRYGEEAIEYIDHRFMEYLSEQNIEFDESDPDWHEDRDEVMQEFLDEYGQEIDEYLGDNGLLEDPEPEEVDLEEVDYIEESIEENESDDTVYQSQNIFSVCYPLKYSELFSTEIVDTFNQICFDNYVSLDVENGCNEEVLSVDDLELALRSFVDNDRNVLEGLNIGNSVSMDYNLGDVSLDYFIMAVNRDDEEKSSCLREIGFRSLGSAIYIMMKNYEENEAYDTEGAAQLISTLSYLKGKAIVEDDLIDEVLNFISRDVFGNSLYENSHDALLMDIFIFESRIEGSSIDPVRSKDLFMDDKMSVSNVFSNYCKNSDLPFALFEESGDVMYGSVDITSRLLFDLILLEVLDD